MAKNVIDLDFDELKMIQTIANINGIDVSTNEKLVKLGLKIVNSTIKSSDDETFIQLTGLKKTI